MNFLRTRNIRGIFLIYRLSQMTLILDNSHFSQKDKLLGMIKWGHMNVCIFLFETQTIKCFSSFFLFRTLLVVLRNPDQMCRISNFWLNSLGSQNSGAQVAWANQRLTFTFQWKSNKQRRNCERMRDKDVNFMHIISIVTVITCSGRALPYEPSWSLVPRPWW